MDEAQEGGSDLQCLLASIEWTFRTHVAPHVQGSLPQSYARTVALMLDQAVKRAGSENAALQEDLADLAETLAELSIAVPPVVASGDNAALELEIAQLEPLLSNALPSLSGERLARADAFLLRRIERRRRWMPDSTPADAF